MGNPKLKPGEVAAGLLLLGGVGLAAGAAQAIAVPDWFGRSEWVPAVLVALPFYGGGAAIGGLRKIDRFVKWAPFVASIIGFAYSFFMFKYPGITERSGLFCSSVGWEVLIAASMFLFAGLVIRFFLRDRGVEPGETRRA
jgi:hypothetical protein